jgi:hypothetical protein
MPRTAQTRQENKETAHHSWTASPKGRRKSVVCSQKQEGRGMTQLEAYAVEITKLVEYAE